jgi:hypothetical protein
LFAETLLADLRARATVDAQGVRWSNFEHQATPPELEPRRGWAHGSAGIIRELLRYARITTAKNGCCDTWYAVTMPDHLPPAGR